MAMILKEKALWFNDVVLVHQLGAVKSRKEIPPEYHRFVCSPMTPVVGKTFIKEATKLGLTVCIPRFLGIDKEVEIFHLSTNKKNTYLSIGLNDIDRIKAFSSQYCENYLIDVAFGGLPQIEETVKLLKDNTAINRIILGNITNKLGFYYLADIIKKYNLHGIIRCGISNGSGCETYSCSGFGSGQLSELLEISPHKSCFKNITIASDGGLKDGGFVSKAFLGGSDYVFIGGMFARSLEAETNISGDSTYFGLASEKNQILSTGKKFRHSEGKEYQINKNELKSLKEIMSDLWGCVSSAVSYSGYSTLSQAIGYGVFQIKQNSLPPKNRV